MNKREGTIKYILPNLLSRWPELKNYNPDKVAACYEEFSLSEDYGNNDKKFPEWFKFIEVNNNNE